MTTRTAIWFWVTVVLCAGLIVLDLVGSRILWVHHDGSSIRDATGYVWMASGAGLVAIVGLFFGRRSRPLWRCQRSSPASTGY